MNALTFRTSLTGIAIAAALALSACGKQETATAPAASGGASGATTTAAAGGSTGGSPAATGDTQFFPLLSYRTGPYAPNGIPWADGKQDYLKMINERDGGINGVKISFEECETGYATDRGVECYERLKTKPGVTMFDPQSTGITFALTEKAPVDKIPLMTFGYGLSVSQNGEFFKWNFPYMGSYWTAADALIQHLGTKEGGLDKLKGKKIALNKGSNVHYLLVRVLEQHGLKITDVQPVYLAPADGRAAFESKNVDAWVIWDPFQAAAEKATGARVLADGTGVVNNYQYYLGERGFVRKNPKVIQALFDDSVTQGIWLKKNLRQAAEVIAPLQGLPVDVVELALRRYAFNVKPLTPEVVADQQRIADTFYALKLIPKAIQVREAVIVPQP